MKLIYLGLFAAVVFGAQAEMPGLFLKEKSDPKEEACDNASCNRACLAIGWNGGYCQESDCWCRRYGKSKFVPELEPFRTLETALKAACDNASCNRACLAIGWNGGYCRGSDCWCWRYGKSKVVPELQPLRTLETALKAEGSNAIPKAVCDNASCNRACLAIGWNGGYCQGSDCWCWRYGKSIALDTQELGIIQSEE